MVKEISLKTGWIRLDKAELDTLRSEMRNRYEFEGGNKKFNSHLPNYDELIEFIRAKISEWQKSGEMDISIQGQSAYDIIPGKTFFKDLFYTKLNSETSQFQEYNIEICYLYTFEKTRFEYKRNEKLPQPNIETKTEKFGIKVLLSSTLNNMLEAEKIKNHLEEHIGIEVETEIRDTQSYSKGTLKEMYDSLDSNSYIFSLMSRDYLQNENCVKELVEYTDKNLDSYLKHTFHILLKDIYSGDFNIFDSLGRSELLKYWILRIERLEENHKLLTSDKKEKEFYSKLRSELDELKKIVEELHRVLDILRESQSSALIDIMLAKITSFEELQKLLPGKNIIHNIDYKLESAYKNIKIPSNNDPSMPEFPPEPFYTPAFPASETFKIKIPGFSNVWLKDESTNPTGTHKDRFAWEVVIKYKALIESLKYKKDDSLPKMSLISSGSAAIAIQHLFNLFQIPTSLKVLVDRNLSQSIKSDIVSIGCELFEYDLSERLLSPEDIKELTNNNSGIDITYREVLDPNHDNYYDWLSYEILREEPEYCFIPFGTGDLFINVLNIVKSEHFYSFVSKHDPRFIGDIEKIKNCHFIGSSSTNPGTRLDKLFSNFLPSMNSFKKYIKELKTEYACVGSMTDIYFVDEVYVNKAIDIANDQKLTFEPSGMAGLALLLQMKDQIPGNSKILIVNTGKTKELNELL